MSVETIDYRAWGFYLQAIQFVGYLVLGIYVWQTNRDKATAREIKEVREEMQKIQFAQGDKCNRHLKRTTVLEGSVQALPTHRDLGEMYEKINGVKSTVDEISGSLKGIGYQMKILIEHHIKREDS
jgi:uncharacterized protein YoxC